MGNMKFNTACKFYADWKAIINSHVTAWSGHETYDKLYKLLHGEQDSMQKYMIERGRKNTGIPVFFTGKMAGYLDAILTDMTRNKAMFVYNVFGRKYSVKGSEYPIWDILPKEIWTHPEFGKCGIQIWKETKKLFSDDYANPKGDYMTFWVDKGVFHFSIGGLINENSPVTETKVQGSEPCKSKEQFIEILLRIKEAYKISMNNIVDISIKNPYLNYAEVKK